MDLIGETVDRLWNWQPLTRRVQELFQSSEPLSSRRRWLRRGCSSRDYSWALEVLSFLLVLRTLLPCLGSRTVVGRKPYTNAKQQANVNIREARHHMTSTHSCVAGANLD